MGIAGEPDVDGPRLEPADADPDRVGAGAGTADAPAPPVPADALAAVVRRPAPTAFCTASSGFPHPSVSLSSELASVAKDLTGPRGSVRSFAALRMTEGSSARSIDQDDRTRRR